jgi:hypothetical protein
MSGSEQAKASAVKLQVNGEDVPLNPFVTAIFASTIKGMVDSLKLEKPPRDISIQITFDNGA